MFAEHLKSIQPEFPSVHASVHHTEKGTPYLKSPGVVVCAVPNVNLSGMNEFLEGYDEEYGFGKYLEDPDTLPPAEQLVKVSGQVCYSSFGPARTMNADVERYIGNLISSGHGSVLEHPNISLLNYGISRSCSHEIIRHRAGAAYSQLSQRYVSGKVLRFVERPEYQNDPELHQALEDRIDRAAEDYEKMADSLLKRQNEGSQLLTAEARTDRRKKVQQTARSLLPNETETVILMTGNVRAWRHILAMRGNEHAETEIRQWAIKVYSVLSQAAPVLFSDFRQIELADGTYALVTPFPKV